MNFLWLQDNVFRSIGEDDFLPVIILIGIPIWTICIMIKLYRTMWVNESVNIDKGTTIKQKYKSLRPPIHSSKEIKVPMIEMWIYPIRGVRAKSQVDSIELGEYGVRYDREILLATRKDLAVMSTNHHNPTGALRQELVGSEVIVTTTKPELL